MEYLNSFHFYGVKNLLGDDSGVFHIIVCYNNGFIEMQREPILLRYPKLNNYLSDDWVIPVQSKLDMDIVEYIDSYISNRLDYSRVNVWGVGYSGVEDDRLVFGVNNLLSIRSRVIRDRSISKILV